MTTTNDATAEEIKALRDYLKNAPNGAIRLRVSPACADLIVETDGEWCSIVQIGGAS